MKNGIRTYKCVGCGVMVTKSCTKNVKFCTPECYHAHKPKNKTKAGKTLICVQCGKSFYVPTNRVDTAVTCSLQCSNEWQGRNKVTLTCKVCNKSFKVSPSTTIYDNRQYCSMKCRNKDPELAERLIKMRTAQSKANPNKFEMLAYSVLDEIGIDFVPQYIVNGKFTVDAFIPSNRTVIQFDGDYWHGNPAKYQVLDSRQKIRVAHDISQDAYMAKIGLRVFRFWQSEFSDISQIKERLSAII
jgi:very-short-patch-repair endonuclease